MNADSSNIGSVNAIQPCDIAMNMSITWRILRADTAVESDGLHRALDQAIACLPPIRPDSPASSFADRCASLQAPLVEDPRAVDVYPDNSGYYGSSALLEHIWGARLNEITARGRRIADIGAGSGRFENVVIDRGADHVIAIEPSEAMQVVKAATAARVDRITVLNNRRADPAGCLAGRRILDRLAASHPRGAASADRGARR